MPQIDDSWLQSAPVQAGARANHARLEAGRRVVSNYASLLFDLVRQRVDAVHDSAVTAVEMAFIKRAVGRLINGMNTGHDAWDTLRQLAAIDPLMLDLPRLRYLSRAAEQQWTEALGTFRDPPGYEQDMRQLRQIFLGHPRLFTRRDFPETLSELRTHAVVQAGRRQAG